MESVRPSPRGQPVYLDMNLFVDVSASLQAAIEHEEPGDV